MSGPPYPLPPAPTGIGAGFTIGISPIGVPPPFNWWQTILAQYANSPILTQLVNNFAQYIDQTANFDDFFDNIWNVDSAKGYGLDIWGRIVGVVRRLQVAQTAQQSFGFEEPLNPTLETPFQAAPFYSGSSITSTFDLVDQSFRTLIFAKALANISNGSIPAINQLLLNLFPGRGNCYVRDNGGMSMTYVFKFILTPVETALVAQSGVLPKPTGVAANVQVG